MALDGSLVVAANNQGIFPYICPGLGRAFCFSWSPGTQPDKRHMAGWVCTGCKKASAWLGARLAEAWPRSASMMASRPCRDVLCVADDAGRVADHPL